MKRAFRLVLLVCAGLVALAFGGTAMAAYTTPKLIVMNPSEKLGAGGPLTVRVEQSKDDDATFRVVIYIPQGYVTSLVPTEGQTIGTVKAQAQANAISPDAILELTGNIKGDTYTAAKYPVGQACAGASTAIAGVYRLELSAAGQTINVPMYVSAITGGPLASVFSAQLVTCLASPYIPVASGGATFGAKLINADLTFAGIFTNPTTEGDYRWSAIWTPYTVGTGAPNPTGTVETQSIDRLAAQLGLNVKVRGKRATFGGTLLENKRGVGGAKVDILVGRTARGVKGKGSATSNARGQYSRTVTLGRGTWYVRTKTTVPTRSAACTARFTPVPCINATLPGFSVFNNRVIRFRVR